MNIRNSLSNYNLKGNAKFERQAKQYSASFKSQNNIVNKEFDSKFNWRKKLGALAGAEVGFIAPVLMMRKYLVDAEMKNWGLPAKIAAVSTIACAVVGWFIGGLYDLNALAEEQLKNKSSNKTDVAKKS